MKNQKNSRNGDALVGALFVISLIFLIGIVTCIRSCTPVDAGQIGVRTQFGKVTENSVEPGLHFVNPIGGRIIKYWVREDKVELQTPVYTKDMQQANILAAFTYALNKDGVGFVHQTYGPQYADRVVYPKVVSAFKDVIGTIEAAELVNSRERAEKAIFEAARAQISESKIPVTITSLVITNIDYSDAFERSIEEKVVAQQNAIRAQNETKRVEEESKQVVVRANAEAEAMRIRAQALKENQTILWQDFIKKWDGKCPQTVFVGGDVGKVMDVSGFVKTGAHAQ